MKFSSLTAALGVLAVTAGCNGVRVIETYDAPSYYEGAFEFATQDGTIRTTVLGSPFGEGTDVGAATVAHMKGATLGRTVTFKPSAWTVDGNVFRVVVLFNGKPPYHREDVCKKAPEIPIGPPVAPTRMEAAFCQGPHLLSSAEGFVDGLSGRDDPKFRELVRGVTLAMIPPHDTNKAGSGEGPIPQ